MKTIEREERPEGVGESPKQAGEDYSRERWRWTEPSVWTERMLTALEKGVKGGKWFSLANKVYSSENLRASWEKVRSNGGSAGVDRKSIDAYEKEAEKNLVESVIMLRSQHPETMKIGFLSISYCDTDTYAVFCGFIFEPVIMLPLQHPETMKICLCLE